MFETQRIFLFWFRPWTKKTHPAGKKETSVLEEHVVHKDEDRGGQASVLRFPDLHDP